MIDKTTRILFIVADKHGCGHYRCINYAAMLRHNGYDVMMAMPDIPPSELTKIMVNHDVIIFQRPSQPEFNDAIFSQDKPVLVETDDMIDALTPENPAYTHFKNGSAGIAAYVAALRAAKGVICSTNYLAQRNRRYNPNCAVVPNYIDASLRAWWPRTIYLDNFVRVGWAGSTSHNEDIVPAVVAAANVCSKYDNTRLLLMSNVPMLRNIIAKNVPLKSQHCIDIVNPVEFADYPMWVNWDVGLAPIKDTEFNRGKSALKFLEYSAKAITTVASPVIPYLETIPDGCALYPRDHTVSSWEEQIDYAVTHADTAGPEMGVRSYQHIVENWLLEDHWTTWVSAVSRLMEGAGGNVAAAPQKVGRNDPCPCGSGRKYKRCHGI